MKNKKEPPIIMVGDFETTVFKDQKYTEVWASALVPLYTENVTVLHSINDTFEYLARLNHDVIIYYHNLKFDGSFWLCYLLGREDFTQAFVDDIAWEDDLEDNLVQWRKDRKMKNKSFKYLISELGQWYSITIKVGGHLIKILDSLKLIPFSVKEIGKGFGTKHRKLEMEYEGYRYAGCQITDEEMEYIKNDVLVVKEALELMFNEGHSKITIGSCCLSEYKSIVGTQLYSAMFPDLTKWEINYHLFTQKTADAFIRKSYKGGWCYYVPEKANRIIENGLTLDVNSLYPSVMHSLSGNRYPIGYPTFWEGDIPIEAKLPDKYYFIRVRTRFKLKPKHLPTIQIKDCLHYISNEWLTTSDIYNPKTGKYITEFVDYDGNIKQAIPDLTLTMTDWELMQKHYWLYDTEIVGGCYFDAAVGLFDRYINKYMEQKITAPTKAIRTISKLFLNNLYGKLASSDDSSFKVAYLKDDLSLGYKLVNSHKKKTVSIACGSAVTSYARYFTITHAQQNYYGADKRGFIYGDTDSIHCDLSIEELHNIETSDKDLLKWKIESNWDKAIFVRQKTYIEHLIKQDGEPCEPDYLIKCAGMNGRCKDLLKASLTGKTLSEVTGKCPEAITEEEEEFLKDKRELTDFTVGLKVPSKLMQTNIRGGILLQSTTFEIR